MLTSIFQFQVPHIKLFRHKHNSPVVLYRCMAIIMYHSSMIYCEYTKQNQGSNINKWTLSWTGLKDIPNKWLNFVLFSVFNNGQLCNDEKLHKTSNCHGLQVVLSTNYKSFVRLLSSCLHSNTLAMCFTCQRLIQISELCKMNKI